MKNQIIISKNGTIITPYSRNQCHSLENFTSLYDNVYHKRVPLTGFMVDNYNRKPAFITHGYSKDFLTFNFPDYEIKKMKEVIPKKMYQSFSLNKDIKFKPVQESIANTISTKLSKKKSKYKDFFINLQTGGGKTLLGVWLSSYLNTKTIILCFSKEILNQWRDTFLTKSTKDSNTILHISSKSQMDDIFADPTQYSMYDVFLMTPGMITSYMRETDYNRFEKFTSLLGIGLIIFDEAHRNMSNIARINATCNVKNTLYLSADYAQGDYRKEKLFYNIFKDTMIIKPEEDEEISMKYTKVIVVEYNSKPSPIESSSIYNRYGYSAEYYMNYQFKKGYIINVIKYILNTILKTEDDYRVLILFTQINHVDKMTNILKETYPDYDIGRYHGSMSDEEKYETKNHAQIIVSTYKSFSTGLDTENIKYVITTNQSNKVEDNQAAGRARPLKDGSDAVFFMISDKGFPYCTNKLKDRIRYLKDTKLKEDPYRLKLKEKDLKS